MYNSIHTKKLNKKKNTHITHKVNKMLFYGQKRILDEQYPDYLDYSRMGLKGRRLRVKEKARVRRTIKTRSRQNGQNEIRKELNIL